jgi:hypothetical protein
VDPLALGPLFVPPWEEEGFGWIRLLPMAVAVASAALLVAGLVRGRLSPPLAVAGIIVGPIVAFGLAILLLMEGSKRIEFCGSCHVMKPLVESLRSDDGSLAATHLARGAVPASEPCYVCHSGYGIWGTFDAKWAGMQHMLHTVTGRYQLPLEIHGTFDLGSCLGCHAAAKRFREVEAHRDRELQKSLLSGEMGCTGACHPEAHPASALLGPKERS